MGTASAIRIRTSDDGGCLPGQFCGVPIRRWAVQACSGLHPGGAVAGSGDGACAECRAGATARGRKPSGGRDGASVARADPAAPHPGSGAGRSASGGGDPVGFGRQLPLPPLRPRARASDQHG